MTHHDQIEGSCHCGNVRFTVSWPDAAAGIKARRCGCSFCRKHGGVWTSHTGAMLSVGAGEEAALSKYRFGTKTADFWVCRRCGVVPVVLCEIGGQAYGVVNVNTLADREQLSINVTDTNFDGEGTDSRLERRKRNWIPATIGIRAL